MKRISFNLLKLTGTLAEILNVLVAGGNETHSFPVS
jgi:hypothetical protein